MSLQLAGCFSQHRAKLIIIFFVSISLYFFLSPSSLRSPTSTSSFSEQSKWRWRWNSGSQSYVEVTKPLQRHPIESLVEDAELKFKRQLGRQSKTLGEAINEYKRRYNRSPPPGFEAWFEEAQKLDSPIIDDFNAINDALEPFWALSARDILDRAQAVIMSKTWLDIYTIKDHKGDQGGPIGDWINSYAAHLPDMQLPYNHLAESRVVSPYETRAIGEATCLGGPMDRVIDDVYQFKNISREPTWSWVIKSCEPGCLALSESDRQDQPGSLRFVNDVSAVKDLCQNPELETQHGNLISPDSTLLAQDLVPVFSRNKMSTFQDILVPTPAYRNRGLLTDEVVPWDQKHHDLYWSGTTTGGYSHNGSWRNTQRFRFVSLMNDPNRPIPLMRKVNEKWEEYQSTVKSVSDQVIAKFTKHKLCTPEDCQAQKDDPTILFGERDSGTEYKNHTLVIDIDGQASTDRYYKLLASGSAVLKQTLMREWHDDRLMPWLHYIPVSMHMEELPELVRFLTQEENGRMIAKKIAEQGRQWWSQALREQDMGLYMFRLLLEWARLIDLKRDEGLPECK